VDVTVINDIINDVVVLGGLAGTLFGFGKSKWFQSAVKFVEKEEPEIAKDAEKILDTPVAKTVEAKLSSEVKKLALSSTAQTVIKGIEKATDGAKKVYGDLSPSEQAAAIAFVKAHIPASVQATEKEIVAALQAAPGLAEDFASDPTFAKATELTQLLTKANAPDAPEQPAQAATAQAPAQPAQGAQPNAAK